MASAPGAKNCTNAEDYRDQRPETRLANATGKPCYSTAKKLKLFP
jgi:hypothetical protein